MTNSFPRPTPNANPNQTTFTLNPLRMGVQAALAPDALAAVRRMTLTGLEAWWLNVFNEVTIRKADDLLACAAANDHYYDVVPKGAELRHARFKVFFDDAAAPRVFEIIPPGTIILQNPEDAPRLLPLLARRGFAIAQKLVLALFLALAGALPDALGADSSNDDDSDEPVEECLSTWQVQR